MALDQFRKFLLAQLEPLGAQIPFARTKAARINMVEPCPALEEHYKDRVDDVRWVARAARILVDGRYPSPEDAERIIEDARKTEARQIYALA